MGVGQAGAVQQAGKAFFEQAGAAQGFRQFGEDSGGQVDLAVLQSLQHGFAAALADFQADSGRLAPQGAGQRRQQAGRTIVGHGQTENAPGGGGVEAAGGQQCLHPRQGFSQRTLQFEGARGRYQAAAAAHQQRVAQQVAQTPQGMAYGWLAQMQALCRAGHMLFGEQGVQHHQQVEIDAAQFIHLLHVHKKKSEFKFVPSIS
ncbi:hypothetical protein D9M71_467910 [compost metagenome]